MIKKLAFTLAEVLIVIGIIGIIAELVLPTLFNSVTDQARVASLKKSYSTVSQAYTMFLQDNGTLGDYSRSLGLDYTSTSERVLGQMLTYVRNGKACYRNATTCFPSTGYRMLRGDSNTDVLYQIETNDHLSKAKLADGTLLAIDIDDMDCATTSFDVQNYCANLAMDINGDKPPNQMGVDLFYFALTQDKLIPYGLGHSDTDSYVTAGCNKFTSSGYGFGCSAWVLYNSNQDYLHCSTSWASKPTCR